MALPVPGEDVVIVDAPRASSTPTDTGTAFFVGEAERGPARPLLVRSLSDFAALLGARQTYSPLYDSVETYFREGGAALWCSRVQSPTAVAASLVLNDAGAAATLRVTAAGVGAYGNAVQVAVRTNADDAAIPAGSFRLRIVEGGNVVEESPTFPDKASALNWAATAKTFVLADLGGANVPAHLVPTNLAGGVDNRGAIADADWQIALDRLAKDLGPGQVAMPGRTTDTAHTQLLDHARLNARHALLDLPDSPTVATLNASARAADVATAANKSGRWGSAWWPWAVVPGLVPFSTRLVPWSAVQAGLAARSDALGNPNQPVAGPVRGVARFANGTSQDTTQLTAADLQSLQDAGVNVARTFYGAAGPVAYGNRTLRQELDDPTWLQASGSRCMMAVAARGGAIMTRHVHSEVDGKGREQARIEGELVGMLGELFDDGALYGDSPGDAFHVDVGPTVNPPDQIALGRLKASVSARVSPGADRVTLELVRVAITDPVA